MLAPCGPRERARQKSGTASAFPRVLSTIKIRCHLSRITRTHHSGCLCGQAALRVANYRCDSRIAVLPPAKGVKWSPRATVITPDESRLGLSEGVIGGSSHQSWGPLL